MLTRFECLIFFGRFAESSIWWRWCPPAPPLPPGYFLIRHIKPFRVGEFKTAAEKVELSTPNRTRRACLIYYEVRLFFFLIPFNQKQNDDVKSSARTSRGPPLASITLSSRIRDWQSQKKPPVLKHIASPNLATKYGRLDRRSIFCFLHVCNVWQGRKHSRLARPRESEGEMKKKTIQKKTKTNPRVGPIYCRDCLLNRRSDRIQGRRHGKTIFWNVSDVFRASFLARLPVIEFLRQRGQQRRMGERIHFFQ